MDDSFIKMLEFIADSKDELHVLPLSDSTKRNDIMGIDNVDPQVRASKIGDCRNIISDEKTTDNCSNQLPIKSKLGQHKKNNVDEKSLSCIYCNKTFANISNKKRHERSHIKPHICSYCDEDCA